LPSPSSSPPPPFSLVRQLLPLLLIFCYSLFYTGYKTRYLSGYNCSLSLPRLYINLTLLVNIRDFE
jgi:hypothetical protein